VGSVERLHSAYTLSRLFSWADIFSFLIKFRNRKVPIRGELSGLCDWGEWCWSRKKVNSVPTCLRRKVQSPCRHKPPQNLLHSSYGNQVMNGTHMMFIKCHAREYNREKTTYPSPKVIVKIQGKLSI